MRNFFLLAASYFFYMNWQPIYALLLVTVSTSAFICGRLIGEKVIDDKRSAKRILVGSLVFNFSFLFIFKYLDFFNRMLTCGLELLGIYYPMPQFSLLLPVGISFFTFQTAGYLIDVYKQRVEPEQDFLLFSLFTSFFPQLVAGPIERSYKLIPQFRVFHNYSYPAMLRGVRLMLAGYFMKLVMADRCALYVDAIFNNLDAHNGGSCLLAALIFPWQIYGDFAGYSLIAVGCARIMGFRLTMNFRSPYMSASVGEFWRRWHITLSGWLRDYVYFPLGGSRKGRMRTFVNLMLTFCISGLWHGAEFSFVVWGFLHGVCVAVERLFGVGGKYDKVDSNRWKTRNGRIGIVRLLRIAVTFVLVSALWVFFRADTLPQALELFKKIFTQPDMPFLMLADFVLIFLSIIVVILYEWGFFRQKRMSELRFLAYPERDLVITENTSLSRHTGTVENCQKRGVIYRKVGAVYQKREAASILIQSFVIAIGISFIILFGVLSGDSFIYFQF